MYSVACLQATEVKTESVNFNSEFISRMIPRLEWPALCSAAESVSSCCTHKRQQLLLQCDVNISVWILVSVCAVCCCCDVSWCAGNRRCSFTPFMLPCSFAV